MFLFEFHCNLVYELIFGGELYQMPSQNLNWLPSECLVSLCISVSNTSLTIWIMGLVPYKRQELITLRELLVFGEVRIAHLFSFLCCVFVLLVFVLFLVYSMLPVSLDCLRPVSCVLNVASVSGLSSSCFLCTQCYQFLWIVFVLFLVYSMLPVSLDCLRPVSCVPNLASVSRLSILNLPIGFL
jgi:hypothetical protein